MKKLPPYFTIVWVHPTLTGCLRKPTLGYRTRRKLTGAKNKYSEEWSWNVLTTGSYLSLSPNEVLEWEKVGDSVTKEGKREYE
jgi:hypothetical protein